MKQTIRGQNSEMSCSATSVTSGSSVKGPRDVRVHTEQKVGLCIPGTITGKTEPHLPSQLLKDPHTKLSRGF